MEDLKINVVDNLALQGNIKTKRENRMVLVLSEEELQKLLQIGVDLKSPSAQRTIRKMIENY